MLVPLPVSASDGGSLSGEVTLAEHNCQLLHVRTRSMNVDVHAPSTSSSNQQAAGVGVGASAFISQLSGGCGAAQRAALHAYLRDGGQIIASTFIPGKQMISEDGKYSVASDSTLLLPATLAPSTPSSSPYTGLQSPNPASSPTPLPSPSPSPLPTPSPSPSISTSHSHSHTPFQLYAESGSKQRAKQDEQQQQHNVAMVRIAQWIEKR